jgi:4-amino-4-deoxy-L-arabinose transferase-like glycosyltransferase
MDRLLGSTSLLRFTLLSSFAIYLQTINFDFVYDDFSMIVLNRWMSSWRGLTQMFLHHSWAFSDIEMPARHYRPMFLVWLWAVQHVFSPSPGWYHLCSLFTHLLAIYLAYRVAKALLKERLGAAIAVLLFAVHPTKVESVSWIAAATEPLMAVFFFAAILAYIRAREGARLHWVWMVVSFLCAVAALLTKETAVVLPGIILAYELFVADSGESKPHLLQMAAMVSPYVLADALWFFARLVVLHGAGSDDFPVSIRSTLLTSPIAIWLYIRQLFWPVHLSALYPETMVHQFTVTGTLIPLAGLLVLGIAYWKWSRRDAVLKFAAVWLLLTLAPVIAGFAWIQLHDRHLYLPSFAVALMAAVAIRQVRWPASANHDQIQVAATLAIALVLTAISANEARVWQTELTLFTRAASVAPTSAEAIDMLAQAQSNNGQPQLALATLSRALQLQPNSPRLTFSLASRYFGVGDYGSARPLLERLAKSGSPDYRATALYDLSVIELGQNHPDSAIALLKKAIDAAPHVAGYRRALNNLERNSVPGGKPAL